MVFRFGVARCCCGGVTPTVSGRDDMWNVNWSNTNEPYDELDQFGTTNAPIMSLRTTNLSGQYASGFMFGFEPWYIFNPMDPFNRPFGGWARNNILLTFRGGGTLFGQPVTDLAEDPTTATLQLWLRNKSESGVDYTLNAKSFWYPNQVDVQFDIPSGPIDPRAPVPFNADPWSPTAVTASSADGLPTESISAADGATVDASKAPNVWYPVNVDITASYRAATQWWRDTSRPTEQFVQYVISMDALQPTAADITNNLTNLFGDVTGASWEVAADADDVPPTTPGAAGHPFPKLSFT